MNTPVSVLHTSYDLTLVVLSYLVAVLASYTALDLGGRVTANRGGVRVLWLAGGALAMGVGIWSMHFIAMLAFRMGMGLDVSYDFGTVLLSVVFAIAGTAVALALTARESLSPLRLVFGGVFMGAGVVAMHYTGMAAMRMAATVVYDPWLLGYSMLIAVGASMAALGLTFRFRGSGGRAQVGPKLLAALIMGAAVSGMHYTGIAAARFIPTGFRQEGAVSEGPLAYTVGIVTSFYLGITLLGTFVDRRLRTQAQRILDSEQRFQSLFAHNLNAIVAVDLDGRVTDANPTTLGLLGLSLDQMYGKTFTEIGILKDSAMVRQAFETTLTSGPQSFETELIANQRETLYSITTIPIIVQGTTLGVYALGKNVTEERQVENRIRHMAYHDDLTGLANRRRFLEELERALASPAKRFLALLMFDLDRFKAVNNAIGQDSGDKVLTQFAQRLREEAGQTALVARIGSDEFAVFFSAASRAEADIRADDLFRRLDRDLPVDEQEIHLRASVGTVVYPDDGDDVDTLIKNADIALMWAKSRGRARLQAFDHEMLLWIQERNEIERGLRKALEREEFEIRYQVQKSMDGRTVGAEALLRWNPPGRRPVPPSDFIPVAEDSGLIKAIGAWVLRTACRQNKAWQDAGLPPITMSVNLSIKQFEQPDFISTVALILAQTGLEPRFLDLEITESMAMEVERTLETLSGLKALGVAISMDDFGTGYSSLSSLKRFPIDSLKIDQSFVRDITEGKDAPIVETVIAVAHTFKLNVVAEGVENEAQMTFLRDHGCDAVQGYLYGQPQTAEEFRAAHLG